MNSDLARKDTDRPAVGRFDRWAATYESDPVSRFIARPQNEALRALDLAAEDRFLDVGCGTGAAVRGAARVARRATGLDASIEMVARAAGLASAFRNRAALLAMSQAYTRAGAAPSATIAAVSSAPPGLRSTAAVNDALAERPRTVREPARFARHGIRNYLWFDNEDYFYNFYSIEPETLNKLSGLF